MTTFFCPDCWSEVRPRAPICPSCGSNLEALDEASYVEKLCRALWHPEGFTARRAAWLLGRRREGGAVEALASRAETDCGIYLSKGIFDALAAIGTKPALNALRTLRDSEQRRLVRRHADALLGRVEAR